jgi:hypothetical protein
VYVFNPFFCEYSICTTVGITIDSVQVATPTPATVHSPHGPPPTAHAPPVVTTHAHSVHAAPMNPDASMDAMGMDMGGTVHAPPAAPVPPLVSFPTAHLISVHGLMGMAKDEPFDEVSPC